MSSDETTTTEKANGAAHDATTAHAPRTQTSGAAHPGDPHADLRRTLIGLARTGALVFVATERSGFAGANVGRIASVDARHLVLVIGTAVRMVTPLSTITSVERIPHRRGRGRGRDGGHDDGQ